jgi:gamma-glutamyltranspeptidase/glutathione hydrolase
MRSFLLHVVPVLMGLAVLPGAERTGVRDPAWSPDGRRLAVSYLDQIWSVSPSGELSRALARWPDAKPTAERDPAWATDGRRVVFAADRGDGFDLFMVDRGGGAPERLTFLPGDERWPSWTPDGRVVFAHRATQQWDLYVLDAAGAGPGAPPTPLALSETSDDEMQPRVSPDGKRVAFASTREALPGDVDIWVMPLPAPSDIAHPQGEVSAGGARETVTGVGRARRVLRADGADLYPSWAPDGSRLAFFATRRGVGSVWITSVLPPNGATSHQSSADGAAPEAAEQSARPREYPEAPPVLLSRDGGQPAWSPDGRTIMVAGAPEEGLVYNGNPLRTRDEPPPLFALGRAYRLRALPAPRAPDEGVVSIATSAPASRARWLFAFDRVWETLRSLYYAEPPTAATWEALAKRYRPRAAEARSERELETVVDAMIDEQPLVKREVTSDHSIVVSAHPRASEAGVRVLASGGNVVDAAIAVSFALGVVEPDASGIGGDGMALLYLRGMARPTLIDFKDQSPSHATLDNPEILRDGQLVSDGPAAANIPGVVAGMDYLFKKYASGDVTWARLLAPAIEYADEGVVLDASLPTTLANGRRILEKYPEAARIYLPNGRVPTSGARFVNRDYASTLRTLATEGARSFYEGSISKRIADDMAEHGGLINRADLAQYRAIERAPLHGRYRGHPVWTAPPPVASGAGLIETLQILGHYDPPDGATFRDDADYLHYAIEAQKARDPMRHVADPARWTVEVDEHLTEAHAKLLFRTIRPDRASRFSDSGMDIDGEQETSGADENGLGRGTTAFVVADTVGNIIVVTQTLSTWGGSFYVSKGLGFLYNNHIKSYRTRSSAYGQLLPLTRSSTTNAVSLVFERGDRTRPLVGVAAAGNQWIVPSVLQTIAGVVDGGLSAQQAVEAPRFLVARDPSDPRRLAASVQIEDRFPLAVLSDLISRGHRFRKIGRKGELRYGYASAAMVDWQRRLVVGGADPRRSHAALAWEPSTSAQNGAFGERAEGRDASPRRPSP